VRGFEIGLYISDEVIKIYTGSMYYRLAAFQIHWMMQGAVFTRNFL